MRKSTNEKVMEFLKSKDNQDAINFIYDAKRWVKAIEQGRMICIVKSVSSSGMSRKFRYMECSKTKSGYYYMNFVKFLRVMGYKNDHDFNITRSGCGMDMNFDTNYSIMHKLQNLGFISKKRCEVLAQMTPTCI
ncbi:MAG TPA: hypothetical protein PLZ43_09285 [bacterium]|nr:hypothetical protein [bacterium]